MRYDSGMHSRLFFLPRFALRGGLFVFAFLFFAAQAPSVFAGGSSPDSFFAGLKTFGVWVPKTGERFDFSVWYPSRVEASENVLEGWIVKAGKRGRIVEGFFPVVLLSHDTGGGRFAHNDIAASLAAAGMIVIAPTHSGDNQNSSSGLYKAETLRTRPVTMLRALETVLESPDFAPHVDESRIGVLGVGAGAVTALQLAGAVPDFSDIEAHCRTLPVADAYCAPWSENRLTRLGPDMERLRQEQGDICFSPPLDLFAPVLVSVPVPPELLEQRDSTGEKQSKSGFWHRLFGKDENDASAEFDTAGSAPPAQGGENGEPQIAQEGSLDEGGDSADFLADSGEGNHGATQGTPPAQSAAMQAREELIAIEPSLKPKMMDGELVFCRPAKVRAIRGIALVAPAGGMLFSRESLAAILAPVAIVEAGKDTLYPPEYHAAPYVSLLSRLPVRLHLPNVDHFSLFARCSADTANTLSAICGNIRGDARQALARERDAFLVSFFQSVLGDVRPVPAPSGLAATAPPEDATP